MIKIVIFFINVASSYHLIIIPEEESLSIAFTNITHCFILVCWYATTRYKMDCEWEGKWNEMFRALRSFQLRWSYRDRVLLGQWGEIFVKHAQDSGEVRTPVGALPLGHAGPLWMRRKILYFNRWRVDTEIFHAHIDDYRFILRDALTLY